MKGKIFIDSNIWLYLYDVNNPIKMERTRSFLFENDFNSELIISFQVINEVSSVLKKKGNSETVIRNIAKGMLDSCILCEYSSSIFYKASELREKFSLSYWDSQIVATALLHECDYLISEDMQNGLIIDKMTLFDIYKEHI